jgi:hypothetical protein
MHINASGISAASLTKVVAEFYAGKSMTQLATRHNVGRGVLAGRLERAGVVRAIQPDAESVQFDAAASRLFADRMAYGFNAVEAGASLGKTAEASRRHALILGLGLPQPDPIRPSAALGGGVATSSPLQVLVSQEHDAAHVAAILAQGGFDRCDFESGWVVGIDGALRYPFTQAAADAARAKIAASQADRAA